MIRTGIVLTAITATVTLAGCGGSASTASAPPASAPPASAPTSAPANPSATTAACPSLTIGEDGTVSPLTCGGSNNPAAVAYYEGGNTRNLDPKVLMLGAAATKSQVTTTICADISPMGGMGLQTETQALQLAANKAGWSYNINVVNLSC